MNTSSINPENLQKLIDIGISLSKEKNIDILLENILTEARQISNSDGGTLYLMIDNETVLITAETITYGALTPPQTEATYTITRAQLGTTADTHVINSRLYYIAPSLKLPSKCKGKKIEIQLKGIHNFVQIVYYVNN